MINRPDFTAKQPSDLLSEAMDDLRINGAVHCGANLSSPWSVSVMPRTAGTLYAVVEGECLLEVEDTLSHPLAQGNIAVVLRARPHRIRSYEPGTVTPLDELLRAPCEGPGQMVRFGGGGELTRIVVGWIDFPECSDVPLIRSLPDVLILPTSTHSGSDWSVAAVETLVHETGQVTPGANALTKRLTELIFIAVVRHYLTKEPQERGWIGALRDERVNRVLVAMHSDPGHHWTLQRLAEIACLSRTALLDRFNRRLGESPQSYLIGLRMRISQHQLCSGDRSVEEIALAVGYSSAAAFSRAFRRARGLPPGRMRSKRQQTT